MATFDLSEFLEDDSLVLEGIRSEKHPDGKAYRFTSPSAKKGLWLKNLIEFGVKANLGIEASPGEVGKLSLDDDEEMDLYRDVMGDTLTELLDDGVSWSRVQQVFGLLLGHYGMGRGIDNALKEHSGEAGARPNRAARRSASKTSTKPTRQAKAGSSSKTATTATPARTRARTSTRSSTSGPGARSAKTA